MYLVKVHIDTSPVEGNGVFADGDVKRGEIVWKFTEGHDQTLSKEDYKQLAVAEKEKLNRIAYLSSESQQYVFPPEGDPALYTNHDANTHNLSVVVDKKISPEPFFVANRDIQKGEELTNNYHEFDTAIGLKSPTPHWLE